MKRILILANFDVGLYKFRKELIQEMLEKNYEVYISLPDGALVRKLEEMGCKFINTPVDRRGINPKTDVKLMFFYRKLIKKLHPDLVVTYTIKPNIYGGLMCRMFRIPYVVNITGLGTAFQSESMVKKLVTFLYKIALKKAKVVFFENVGNKQTFLDLHILKESQICVLNGAGVNLGEYPFCEYPSENETRFLFIGRVMKEKGIDELFETAEKVKRQHLDVFFDVVGPMEDDYKERIDELVQKGIIVYHGYQKDVKPYIEKCHCFVLPSYHEGMANTLLEAGAMGRPLITSKIHGCMETVEEGRNGYLVEAKNTESLLEKMERFLGISYEEKIEMGQASRELVQEKFDKKKVVEKTMREIER